MDANSSKAYHFSGVGEMDMVRVAMRTGITFVIVGLIVVNAAHAEIDGVFAPNIIVGTKPDGQKIQVAPPTQAKPPPVTESPAGGSGNPQSSDRLVAEALQILSAAVKCPVPNELNSAWASHYVYNFTGTSSFFQYETTSNSYVNRHPWQQFERMTASWADIASVRVEESIKVTMYCRKGDCFRSYYTDSDETTPEYDRYNVHSIRVCDAKTAENMRIAIELIIRRNGAF